MSDKPNQADVAAAIKSAAHCKAGHDSRSTPLMNKLIILAKQVAYLEGEVERMSDANLELYNRATARGNEIELGNGVFRMIAEQLKALGCCHDESTHDGTPAMMYDDWILCVVRKRELEIQRLTLIEQATKTYIEIFDGPASALVVLAAFDDLTEAVEPATEKTA